MTKQQVTEALRICSADAGCVGCPYISLRAVDCSNTMMKDAAEYLARDVREYPIREIPKPQPKAKQRQQCTVSEAPKSGVKKGRHSKGGKKRPVLMMDDTGKVLQRFRSVADASRACGRVASCICACCNGSRQTIAGYRWMYEDDYRKKVEECQT